MINKTIVLIVQLEDFSNNRLARHFSHKLAHLFPHDVNFYQPMQEVFSKVIHYDIIRRTIEIGVRGVNEEIVELVKKENAEYVFWLPARYELREATLDRIRNEGAVLVAWFGDDHFKFDSYTKWWLPHLDYSITIDIDSVPKYEALGARVIHTIHHSGQPVDIDWSTLKTKYEISFVGSIEKPGREEYLRELQERNFPVSLFVKEWGGYVPFDEMLRIFSTSRINLNFSRASHSERTGIKGRVTEICLAGGFLLTEYTPGIEDFFEIDEEIVCFRNTEEMIYKINYYLAHEEERQTIARAGWERATAEYTPVQMITRIFDTIEKDNSLKTGNKNMPAFKTPSWVKRRFSNYFSSWQKAFLLEGDTRLAGDAFRYSISYNPFNVWAWSFYLAGFLPRPLRLAAYRAGRMVYHAVSRLRKRLSD